jgi:hypothetical protein
MPEFGLPSAAHAVGILPGQAGGSYLVLDGAALRADEELSSLVELDEATARVLLIEARGTRVGFIVPHLRAIEQSVWEERRADADPGAPVSLAGSALVKIGGRMLPRIDLEQVVRTMVTDHERSDPAGDRRAFAHA